MECVSSSAHLSFPHSIKVNPNARANDFVLSKSRNPRLLGVVIVSYGVGDQYGIGYYAYRVRRLDVGQ
jgi:hypothetical protein